MANTTLSSFPVATSLNLSTDFVVALQWNGSGFIDKRISGQGLYNSLPATSLTIGTVNTGAAGTQALASIGGMAPNYTLNLTIPQGAPGTAGGGTGNVNPSGAITTGSVAVFTDASGNYISAGVPSTVRSTLGLGSAALQATSAFLQPANNLSDVSSAAAALGNLGGAPLASPTFTGTVTVPTPTVGDNTTKAASTAFVAASFAPLASPALTGTPTAPTASVGTSTTQLATTAFVAASYAPLASPALTGTPTAPTASAGTNTTQLATTAFVLANSSSSFPVTGIVAKSGAYTILTGDKGTMFDLTGSFALTLPAASSATPSAPLYYHVRKRDGSGRCTVAPNGTDTIEGTNAAIAVYQERLTLVSFGSGWYFPPGGREKTVYVVPPNTAFSAVSSLAATTGFDSDVAEFEVSLVGVTFSGSAKLNCQLFQNGAYVTSGYTYGGTDATTSYVTDSSTAGTFIPVLGSNTSSTVTDATITLRNIQSTAAKGGSVEARAAGSAGAASNIRGWSSSANAIAGIKGFPDSGTFSGTYSQRITRQ